MKTRINSVSPFIILLIPALLAVFLTIGNTNAEVKPDKLHAASWFRISEIKSTFIRVTF